jgi:hypothetical protein
MGLVAVLVAASLVACRREEYLREREEREAQIVAIHVRTDPRGAAVRVNQLERTWTTPCDVADFSLQRGYHEVEVSHEGYETVATRVYYDGQKPAQLLMKLRPRRGDAPVAAAPAPAKPAEEPRPAAAEPALPPEPPKPAPLKIESVAGGTRLKVTSPAAKIRIQAKTVVSEPDKPGEYLLPDVPPEKVVVELIDPKTDAVIGSVEFAPTAPAAKAPVPVPAAVPAPKDPVIAEADRVGEVKLVHKTFGVFVKLDPGLSVQPGEEIMIFRDGKEIARTKILKITKGDEKYPDGAAEVKREGSIQKGDEVRRTKP